MAPVVLSLSGQGVTAGERGPGPPEQPSGPVQPWVCLSSDQPRDPPTGLGCATGLQGACVLTCIFTSFCPQKTPAVALLRG